VLLIGRANRVIPPHSHQAIPVVFGYAGPVGLRAAENESWTACPLGIVASRPPHSLDATASTYNAVSFVEPETALGRSLTERYLQRGLASVDDAEVRTACAELFSTWLAGAPKDRLVAGATRVVTALALDVVPALVTDERILRATAYVREHLGAEVPRELDGRRTQGAGRAVDEDAFAARERTAPEEAQHRHPAERERGGLLEREVGRLRGHEAVRGEATVLGVTPMAASAKANTSSPAANARTSRPACSTTPESSVPRMGCRGRVMPKASRPSGPKPGGSRRLRTRQSPVETVVARTLIRISWSRGAGVGTSRRVTTSGGP
jgi:hypothetical protein